MTLAHIPPAVADAMRDLRKKIDRAAPTVKLVEKGDLKVLNDAERRSVEMYPRWVEQLEYIRAHKALPPMEASIVKKQHHALEVSGLGDGGVAAADDEEEAEHVSSAANGTAAAEEAPNGVVPLVPKTSTKSNKGGNKVNNKNNKAGGASATPVVARDAVSLATLVVNTGDHRHARRTLIDSFITSQLDHNPLRRLTKEYDELCSLRKDIVSGRIAKPTNVQKARIELIAVLQREMQLERSKIDSQTTRMRLHIKATLADVIGCDEADIDELGYEVPKAVEADIPPEPGTTIEAEVVTSVPVEADAATATSEAVAESDRDGTERSEVADLQEEANSSAPEEPAQEDVQPKEDANETLAKRDIQEAEVSESRETDAEQQDETEAVDDTNLGIAETVPQEEQQVAIEEKVVEAAPALPPPPPKEIDWSEVTIIKNHVRLEQKVLTTVELADMRRRREHSRDPSAARRRSASAANRGQRVNPFVMDCLTLCDAAASRLLEATTAAATSSPAKGIKKAATTKAPNIKDAPNKGTPTATSSTPLSQLHSSVVARVMRDIKFCQRHPLRNVRFDVKDTDLRCWFVNVSPMDGPLAGVVVPLQMRFGDLYPQEPPTVQCMVSVPHPAIVNSRNLRDTLCFEHTKDGQWEPSLGAFSVLSQLQSFFSTESFNGPKRGAAASTTAAHRQKLAVPLADISRYSNPAIQHYPFHPNPPLPVFNGPFSGKNQVKLSPSGELSGPGSATWIHAYAGEGAHVFKCKVLIPPKAVASPKKKSISNGTAKRAEVTIAPESDERESADLSTPVSSSEPAASTPVSPPKELPRELLEAAPYFVVGVVAPNGASADRVGSDEYGWAFHTGTGTLRTNGKLMHPFSQIPGSKRSSIPDAAASDDDGDSHTTNATTEESASHANSPSHAPSPPSLAVGMFPLKHNTTIQFTVNVGPDCSMDIMVDGVVVHSGVALRRDIFTPPVVTLDEATVAGSEGQPTYGLQPAIYFPQQGVAAEMEFVLHAKSLEEWSSRSAVGGGIASSSPRVASPRPSSPRGSLESTQNNLRSMTPSTPRVGKATKSMPPASSTLALPKLSKGRVATPGTVSMETESTKAATDIEVALDVLGLRPLRCLVSLATQSEATLGLLVEVAQDPKTFSPINVSSRNASYLSADAFPQYKASNKASPGSRRTTVLLPLMLSADHAAKALPILKIAVTNMCRNPDASTAYVPPFKPQCVPLVFSSALFSIVDELEGRLPSAKATSFVHMLHAALALADSSEQVSASFKAIISAVATKADATTAIPTEKHVVLAIALSNVAYFPTAIGAQSTEEWLKYIRGCLEIACNLPGGGSSDPAAEGGDPLAALPAKRRKAVLRAIIYSTAVRQSLHAAVLCSPNSSIKSPFEALCSLGGFLRFSDLVWIKGNEAKLCNLTRWAAISAALVEALEE